MRRLLLCFIVAGTAVCAGAPIPPDTPIVQEKRGIPAALMNRKNYSGDFDRPPRFLSGEAPAYPLSRLLRRESGAAEIACIIDETGQTRDFRVLRSDYPFFASHAILALQKWRFAPATKHGHPIRCTVRIPFYYRFK